MKVKLLISSYLSAIIIACSSISIANLSSSSTATAVFKIAPAISVRAKASIVDIGRIGNGEFGVTLDFSIAANTKAVNMFVEASPFYFGGDPDKMTVKPIALSQLSEVTIDTPDAASLKGGRKTARYLGYGNPIENFPTRKTEMICLESNGGFNFIRDIPLRVYWHQDDNQKAAGRYEARVRLTCIAASES